MGKNLIKIHSPQLKLCRLDLFINISKTLLN